MLNVTRWAAWATMLVTLAIACAPAESRRVDGGPASATARAERLRESLEMD